MCFLFVYHRLPCYVPWGKWVTVGIDPFLVRSVGVTGLWHGGLCELTCCVWRSVSGFEGVVQFYMPVLGGMSLEVECISSDREVELNGLSEHDGKCQLSLQHMVCEG